MDSYGGRKTWLFVIYLIIALYVLNMAFNFVKLPDFFLQVSKWILVIAGALIIVDSFRFLRSSYY